MTTTPTQPPRSIDSTLAFCRERACSRWPGTRVLDLSPLRGDASTRSYLRLRLTPPAPASVVVMVLQDAAVALSSEELAVFGEGGPKELAFLNVGRFLAALTDAVPAIYAVSSDSTLLLLEDVGDTPLWEAPGDTETWFGLALDLIADLQARARDDGSGCYAFAQAFDERLFSWEFEHFLEYGIDRSAAPALVAASREELAAAARRLAALPRVFAHRDYHAWNIHVQEGRLRVIDFQDALLAPALYDVASLLTDRSTPEKIDPATEQRLLHRFYQKQAAGRLTGFDDTLAAYRLVALQRVLKVVGRFHYLAEVKGKPHYLSFLPAVVASAERLLAEARGVEATRRLFEDFGRRGGGQAAV